MLKGKDISLGLERGNQDYLPCGCEDPLATLDLATADLCFAFSVFIFAILALRFARLRLFDFVTILSDFFLGE